MRTIRIGSRASQLALAQAAIIVEQLREHFPQHQYEVIKIKTMGDKILDKTLDKIGGKGLFVKEIQNALLENRIDLAVHSMKDMPAQTLEQLHLAAIPRREDPRDALVTKKKVSLRQLGEGAVIGSSSLRRQAQLLNIRPDLKIIPIRGNVGGRLEKLENQPMDGVILAVAGLKRLGLAHRIDEAFTLSEFVPAVGQGALGCEIRRSDEELYHMLQKINDEESYQAVMAERSFLALMEGGCHIPIGAYGEKIGHLLKLTAMVASPDGGQVLKESMTGDLKDYHQLGKSLGEKMIELGARRLLAEIKVPKNRGDYVD